MASSLNAITLIGRLTADPELRYTPSGAAVANFTIAVDRKFSKNDETDFIPVVAWQRLAEICNEYLHKGKLVCIQGSLQTRSYEDKDGNKRKAFEVKADEMVMLDKGSQGGGQGNGGGQRQAQQKQTRSSGTGYSGGSNAGFPPADEALGLDEIPFAPCKV